MYFIFYYNFTAQVLKVCRAPGSPTACLKLLHKVCLKRWRKKKKSMTGPGQPLSNSIVITVAIPVTRTISGDSRPDLQVRGGRASREQHDYC